MIVVALGPEVARPFVHAACVRYKVAFDPESGGDVIWWGGIERQGVHAIAGWAPSGDDEHLILFGPFGDGSGFEDVWMNEILHAMQTVSASFIVIPASPSLFIRRQSAQLERYGSCRTPQWRK